MQRTCTTPSVRCVICDVLVPRFTPFSTERSSRIVQSTRGHAFQDGEIRREGAFVLTSVVTLTAPRPLDGPLGVSDVLRRARGISPCPDPPPQDPTVISVVGRSPIAFHHSHPLAVHISGQGALALSLSLSAKLLIRRSHTDRTRDVCRQQADHRPLSGRPCRARVCHVSALDTLDHENGPRRDQVVTDIFKEIESGSIDHDHVLRYHIPPRGL